GDFSFWVRKSMPCRGREQDGMRHLLPEQRDARINLLYIHEHLRTQTNLVKRLPIPTKRQFIRCAAGDVFVGKVGETLFGQRFEISQANGKLARVTGLWGQGPARRWRVSVCRVEFAKSGA